jgi:BclB C-terminal domain
MNIALQLNLTTNTPISALSNVLFDQIVYQNGNVSYNPVTGVITVSDPGRYQALWNIVSQSSPAAPDISFALNLLPALSGSNPVKTGQTSGFAAFDSEEPIALSLQNLSTSPVFTNTIVPVKASLLLVEVDVPAATSGDSIIALSSGPDPVVLTSVLGGLVGLPSFIAFGDAVAGVSILGTTIDLTSIANMAFSVPRDGTITDISAFFSVTLGTTLIGSNVNVTARLYQSVTPGNIFTEVAGTTVTLSPALTGIISVGAVTSGILSGLAIPVTAGTRLLMVYSITVTGVAIATSLTGSASAGVAIA